MEEVYRPDPNGPPLVVEFTLAGAPYMILNGGMAFEHTPAVSISVLTRDQDETDRLWDALTEDGEEGDCGWLKDRWGMHWQIVPEALPIMMASDDKIAAGRAHAAMMQMNRIDIAALTAAFEGREETGQ
ncbi:MAG: VOC family protein [Minwuia sp.]|uniref:VOC family protein n=1 Tax=Minwuia sp. TaxID=2493630 RepID=UPI003A874469